MKKTTEAHHRQFQIKHLLFATLIFGGVFAIGRMLGGSGLASMFQFAFFFGPVVGFFVSRYGPTRGWRVLIATVTLALLALIAYAMFVSVQRLDVVNAFLSCVLCVWGPQTLFIVWIHAAWKSGLQSASIR